MSNNNNNNNGSNNNGTGNGNGRANGNGNGANGNGSDNRIVGASGNTARVTISALTGPASAANARAGAQQTLQGFRQPPTLQGRTNAAERHYTNSGHNPYLAMINLWTAPGASGRGGHAAGPRGGHGRGAARGGAGADHLGRGGRGGGAAGHYNPQGGRGGA